MIKYIATDLDGTLFYPKDKKNIISKSNLFFLQSFIDDGGKIVLVSGRSIDYGKKVIEKIGRECAIIGYNGAVIYDNKEIIKDTPIPREEIEQIINDSMNIYKLPAVLLMSNSGIHVHFRKNSRFLRWCYLTYNKKMGIYAEKIASNDYNLEDTLKNTEIYKIMLFVGITKKKINQAREMNKVFRNAYSNLESSWSNEVIEVTLKGSSKGEAVKEYCQLKQISPDEIAVVGDSGNDISMFKEYQDNSFCMSHAPKSIQKYAKFTIDKFEDLSRYLLKK